MKNIIILFIVVSAQVFSLETIYLSRFIKPTIEDDSFVIEMDASFCGSLMICRDATMGVVACVDIGQKGTVNGKVIKVTDEWDVVLKEEVKLIKGSTREERNERYEDGYSVMLKDKDGIVELQCPKRPEIIQCLRKLCVLSGRKFRYVEIDGRIDFHPGSYEK